MSALQKTTEQAYDNYGNKIEAKETVQSGRSEVAEFRRDAASAIREADVEALRAISVLQDATRNIDRIDNEMTGRGEFISIFQRTLKTIAANGVGNGRIAWKGHLQKLKQNLDKEAAQFLKD